MNGTALRNPPIHRRPAGALWLRQSLRLGLHVAAIVFLTGCTMLPSVSPPVSDAQSTAIAAQVAILAATGAAAQQTAVALAGQQTSAALAAQPSPVIMQPTYTPLPTYTPQPTFTAQPTYTPYPTFTLLPAAPPATQLPQVLPTAYYPPTAVQPVSGRPYTLRVRNHFRSTYWIGTVLPYGGNFIKPRWYVEFYPPQATWMRVWYCRYSRYFYDHWDDSEWVVYEKYWKKNHRWDDRDFWDFHPQLYNCGCIDVYVDQPFLEVGVP